MDNITLDKKYANLTTIREPYLERARKCSALSIPSLIPNTTGMLHYRHAGGESFDDPWQSMAARCVNNLASRLMLALLPPNTPFFRLMIQPNSIPEDRDPEIDAMIERGLSKMERTVVNYTSTSSDRVVVHEALKHLIVGGNALLYLPPISEGTDNPPRCYHLGDYVVRRAPNGDVLEIITRESVTLTSLPESIRNMIIQEEGQRNEDYDKAVGSNFNIVDIYTGVIFDESAQLWRVHQECKGHILPDSKGTYPKDYCPWLPMRFIRVDGEDYGRSYVEEYYGDISSLDALYEALVQAATAAAKVVFMVNPNSATRAEDLAEAPNLGFVAGMPDDVTVLQLQKYGDLKVAKEMVTELERRLAHAFILNSAVQRDAERVTAEEIRRMVEDLEAALGGIYSLLAVEFQLPYVRIRMRQMEMADMLPKLPDGAVRPAIVTGVEALGRGNDKTKLLELGQQVAQILGPEQMSQLINPTEFLRRLIAASGIDEGNLLIDPQETAAKQEQMQMLGMAEKLGPEVIRQFGNMANSDPVGAQAMMNSMGGA